MLEESRARLRASQERGAVQAAPARAAEDERLHALNHRRPPLMPTPVVPPPITDVLRDVYEEEKKTA
jgi:hypothetical protein